MDTVEVERANDPGYGSGGARTYDRYGEGDPRGGQFAPKGTSSSGRSPLTSGRPYVVKPKGGGGSGSTPRASSKFKTLGMGEDNDPAAVAEMQQLLTALGLGNLTSGTYDKDTEAAVMEAQRRLGVKKPNGKASKALINKMLAAYDLSPCVKRSDDLDPDDIERGHPYPGQRYRHGWIPVAAGASLDDLFGPAVTMDGDDNEWVDHEEVSHYDTRELIPGLNAELFDDGTVLLAVPSAEDPDRSHIVQYLASQEDANQLAEDVSWAMFRDTSDQGHRPPDPVNGLSDWKVSAPGDLGGGGIIVGFTPDGTVRVAFPDGNTGNVIAIDMTSSEARDFQAELERIASTDIEWTD